MITNTEFALHLVTCEELLINCGINFSLSFYICHYIVICNVIVHGNNNVIQQKKSVMFLG